MTLLFYFRKLTLPVAILTLSRRVIRQDVGKTSTLSINAPFDCGIEKTP